MELHPAETYAVSIQWSPNLSKRYLVRYRPSPRW